MDLLCRLAPEYGVAPTDRKLLWQEMTIIKNEAMSFEQKKVHYSLV